MSVIFEEITRNICRILINRPKKCNSLNLETLGQLRNALDRFNNDRSYNVAVICGSGGNFCAGYDLSEIVDPKTELPNIPQIEQMLWPLGSRLTEDKICIAAIEGHAAGFGYELALKCHFRIAEKDSRMGFMNRRFGIPILNGGSVILPKLIGQARAMELVATGKAQLALEALQYGVITYISDVGCAFGRSINLARCLAKFDQAALLNDLQSNQGQEMERLQLERSRGMEYLRNCGPLDVAAKFVRGELGRHGSFDMGNLSNLEPEVTL